MALRTVERARVANNRRSLRHTVRDYLLTLARASVPVNFPPRRWWREYRHWRRLRRLAGQRLLLAFARAHPAAYFVQIGANDGSQQDPLRFVRERYSWSGLMVEPVPYVFARLKANWGHVPQLVLDNVAVADRDGVLPFYHPAQAADTANLPSWYDGLGSFSKENVLKHADLIPDIAQRIVATDVPCLTLASLCCKHAITRIDVLHIDAEGYDARIVRQLDFAQLRPRLIIYEHFHQADSERTALRGLLEDHGYGWLEEYLDTWCLDLRPPLDAALLNTWRRLPRRTP